MFILVNLFFSPRLFVGSVFTAPAESNLISKVCLLFHHQVIPGVLPEHPAQPPLVRGKLFSVVHPPDALKTNRQKREMANGKNFLPPLLRAFLIRLLLSTANARFFLCVGGMSIVQKCCF